MFNCKQQAVRLRESDSTELHCIDSDMDVMHRDEMAPGQWYHHLYVIVYKEARNSTFNGYQTQHTVQHTTHYTIQYTTQHTT